MVDVVLKSDAMKLIELFQACEFDEVMSVITEMFPGTRRFRAPLKQAYLILLETEPVPSDKSIHYRVMTDDANDDASMGAADADFEGTWAECLGRNVLKDDEVDLSDLEIAANCLVNLCFISEYPRKFENAYRQLLK